MKMTAFLAMLLSANAWACPNLTGTYTCKYQDGSTEVVTFSQENKAGVETYNYKGSAFLADNVARQMPDDDTLKKSTFRAWCEGDKLKTRLTGQYYTNGTYYGQLTLTATLTKNGFDLEMIKAVHEISSVPIIASGGAGRVSDFPRAIASGAEAVLAASVFHFGEITIMDVKEEIAKAGYSVRR